MGYVAVPRIVDIDTAPVLPFPPGTVLPPLGDNIAVVTRTASGIAIEAPGFHIAADIVSGVWQGLTVIVGLKVTDLEVERLNKYLKGTGWPRYETNWRSKAANKVCINLPGKRIPVPIRASGILVSNKLDTGSFRWTSLRGGVSGGGSTTVPKTPVTSPPPVVAPTPVVAPPPPSVAEAALTPTFVVWPPKVVSPAGAALSPEGAVVAELPPSLRDWRKERAVSPVKPEPEVRPLKAERIAPVGDTSGVFTWPTTATDIVIPAEIRTDLDRLWTMHKDGDRQVIILVGPAGTGKTSLAYDMAARNKVPIAKIDAAGAVTFADWVGFQSASEQNGATVTAYQPSGFMQAVRADGPMAGQPRIVLIDEINRAESSGSLNALLPVLDHTGSLYVADAGRSIPLDPAVMFMMTCNMGGEFTGTVSLDAALVDRMTHWIDMAYPTKSEEILIVTSRTGLDEPRATTLVEAATQIRVVAGRGEIKSGVGPRKVLQAARKVAKGFSMRSACHSTWTLAYDPAGAPSERDTVRSTIESIIPK
jgi:hypothetical protein